MILITGILLLLWLITVPVTALHLAGIRRSSGKGTLILFLCLVPLVIFFLRPDEELEAGEDPGSYLHGAISFAREQRLRFSDAGLALVPAAERPLFRYGHAGFMATKDAVLWSRDLMDVEVGPHFLPAYSVLLSVPVSLGMPYGVFWISPFLALLGALMAGLLARAITRDRWTFWIAGLLYLLNPVVAWNARTLRAEWPAALLILGGLALLFEIQSGRQSCKWWVYWLAGFSLAGAMLFHITAIYILLPVMVVMLFDRVRKPMPFGLGVAMGSGLLVLQLVYVSDPYWILPQFASWQNRFVLFAAVVVLLAGPWAAGWFWRWWIVRRPYVQPRMGRMAGALLSVSFVLVVLYTLRYRAADGALPFLPSSAASYISLTDFRGVARLFSRFWLLVAMAGLPVLTMCGADKGFNGRRLLCMLGPAALVVGWMNNYMFETRRLLLAWVPLAALATVVFCQQLGWLAGRLHARRPFCKSGNLIPNLVMLGLAGLCLAVGMRGRLVLYRTWNHKGMFGHYRRIAQAVAGEGDVLLASYTQTAVPVESLSGLPLLPVAWGYRSEAQFRSAEAIFRRLVHENPETRFLFLTPFQGASLPGLALEKAGVWHLGTHRLRRSQHAVPDLALPLNRRLSLYRVHAVAPDTWSYPYIRVMDGDRFGLQGGANLMPGRTLTLDGVWLPEHELDLRALLPHDVEPDSRLLLFFADPTGLAERNLQLRVAEGSDQLHVRQVSDVWHLVMIPETELTSTPVVLHGAAEVYLTDAYLLQPETVPVRLDITAIGSSVRFKVEGVDSQWLHARAGLALPVDGENRHVYLHAAKGADADVVVGLGLSRGSATRMGAGVPLQDGWQWLVIPLPAAGDGVFTWYDMQAEPPWDPEVRGFPEDLGLRISTVIVE